MLRHWIYLFARLTVLGALHVVAGCSIFVDKGPMSSELNGPGLTPESTVYRDLINLPAPAGRITAAVYGFRDQTGQYKQAPSSSFSTAVTQGAASILTKALLDSNWFYPVEREALSDLLTERKIVRAAHEAKSNAGVLPSLMSATILLSGGIVGYDTNVKTGGTGVRYFGIGASEQYRMDQVTVNLRAVEIRTGRVLASVSTTKTVYSYQLDSGVFRFVKFKRLLEAEAGLTRNEPAQLCVRDAIESAVLHLIARGVTDGLWRVKNPEELTSGVLRPYLRAKPPIREPEPLPEQL